MRAFFKKHFTLGIKWGIVFGAAAYFVWMFTGSIAMVLVIAAAGYFWLATDKSLRKRSTEYASKQAKFPEHMC